LGSFVDREFWRFLEELLSLGGEENSMDGVSCGLTPKLGFLIGFDGVHRVPSAFLRGSAFRGGDIDACRANVAERPHIRPSSSAIFSIGAGLCCHMAPSAFWRLTEEFCRFRDELRCRGGDVNSADEFSCDITPKLGFLIGFGGVQRFSSTFLRGEALEGGDFDASLAIAAVRPHISPSSSRTWFEVVFCSHMLPSTLGNRVEREFSRFRDTLLPRGGEENSTDGVSCGLTPKLGFLTGLGGVQREPSGFRRTSFLELNEVFSEATVDCVVEGLAEVGPFELRGF